jgi:hypothetical protein
MDETIGAVFRNFRGCVMVAIRAAYSEEELDRGVWPIGHPDAARPAWPLDVYFDSGVFRLGFEAE